MDSATIWAFFLVFLRCSALLLSSPVFSSNTVPTRIRVYLGMILSMALTFVVKPQLGPVPDSLHAMAMEGGHEILVGLLLGALFSLVLQAAQMAGSILDLQLGLSMSQVLNPVSGVSVTVLGQFKFMLAAVLYVCADAHHVTLRALVFSYKTAPPGSAIDFGASQAVFVDLLGQFSMLALQIAAPVFVVSLVVDAALGLVSKAVPQMQVFVVGMPAKTIAGLSLIAVTLPALTVAVRNGVELVADRIPAIMAVAR